MNSVDQYRQGSPTHRWVWLCIFLIPVALLAYGYYLQHVKYLDPCPLCITQRAFYMGIALAGALGVLSWRRWGWQRFCALLASLSGIGGIITAGRQVWLQHLPPDQVPECGPGLQFWLENMPYLKTLELLFKGDGNCAEVHWRFMGLSIGEWSLGWFVVFTLIALRLLFVSKRTES